MGGMNQTQSERESEKERERKGEGERKASTPGTRMREAHRIECRRLVGGKVLLGGVARVIEGSADNLHAHRSEGVGRKREGAEEKG
jgi:hypothetical protein